MRNTRFWQGMPIVLVVLATALVVNAAEREEQESGFRWDHSLKTAWRTARDRQRPMLLFVTIDGCAHCQRMKQTTLQDKHVQEDLQSHFIPVSLNAVDEPEFVKLLQVRSFPTTVIIEPNGDVVESIRGYQTPKQLRERLLSNVRQASHAADEEVKR